MYQKNLIVFMVFGTSTDHAHTHLSFQPDRQSRTCKVTNMLYAHLHLSEYLGQVSCSNLRHVASKLDVIFSLSAIVTLISGYARARLA